MILLIIIALCITTAIFAWASVCHHAIDAAERTTRYSQEKSPAGKQVEAIDAGGRFAAQLLDWRHMVFFAWLVSLLARHRR